jgi:hypothetical protein
MVALAGSKKAAGMRKLFKRSTPSFPLAAYPKDRRMTSPLLSSRHSSSMLLSCCPLSARSTLVGWSTSSERHTLAPLPGFPPPAQAPASHGPLTIPLRYPPRLHTLMNILRYW